MSFEQKMKNLEQMVKTLEDGDLPLEKALENFGAGVKMVNELNKLLDQAEQKINVLVKQEDGSFGKQAFESEEA